MMKVIFIIKLGNFQKLQMFQNVLQNLKSGKRFISKGCLIKTVKDELN